MSEHKSRLSPKAVIPSAESFQDTLQRTLVPYCLEQVISHEYTILFEGWTDVSYAQVAAMKYRDETGIDLMLVGPEDSQSEILLATPGKDGDPKRGGTPQLTRLARDLQPFVFTFQCIKGIAFVFDHDDAGIEADQKVTSEYGFQRNKHTFTLDPKYHPNATARKQVCVEDLLSIRIQTAYFDLGDAFCDATYEAGKIVRYKWSHHSKDKLRDFVMTNASSRDLSEIITLIKRIRHAWGFVE